MHSALKVGGIYNAETKGNTKFCISELIAPQRKSWSWIYVSLSTQVFTGFKSNNRMWLLKIKSLTDKKERELVKIKAKSKARNQIRSDNCT